MVGGFVTFLHDFHIITYNILWTLMTKNPEIFLHFNSKPLIASRFPLRTYRTIIRCTIISFFLLNFFTFRC